MEWFYSILAGLFGAISLVSGRRVGAKRNWKWTSFFLVGTSMSLLFLLLAMKTLPMLTAYIIWAGIGVSVEELFAMVSKDKVTNWKKIFFITLVLGATLGFILVP